MAREYKDSGIEWIGQIPKEWKVSRIKTIFSERTELSENGDETLLSVSEYYGVANRKEKIEDGDFVSRAESLVGYKKCYKGDLVSNIMLAWKGSLGVTDIDGIVSPAYCVYQPSKEVFPHYYHYLFRTSLFTSIFRLYSKGIIDSRLRLYSPFFFAISTLIPPFSEQQKIADYLDRVCGEIDEMVALQETMIEELKAYKQSVITEAVTKGLNPNVPMRNSGIDWIGEIPKHWEVIKMRRCVESIGDVDHYMPDSIETGIPYIMTRDLADRTSLINKDQCKQISYEDYVNLSRKIKLEKNDVIFARYASIGNVCYVDTDEEMIVSYSCVIIKPLPILSGLYLFYYLKSKTFEEEVLQFVNTNIQGNVGIDSLYKTKMMMPPLVEQRAIASYLDNKCSEIDSLIALKQAKIEELKEYKKSVIYEYVTGKKEVV